MHLVSVISVRLEVMNTMLIAFITMLTLVTTVEIGRYEMDFTSVMEHCA